MKRKLLIALLLFVIPAACYYVWTGYLRQPALLADRVELVEISLHDQMGNKTQQTLSKDPAKISALVEVLRTGKPASDHKCGNSGKVTLVLFGDTKIELGLLAGHHPEYYEFRLYTNDWRQYEMYRVDRAAFLAALESMQITQVDLGGPE